MNEREKLTRVCCPLCGVGGAVSCSHAPEQDNVSRKAWRQVLLFWLLCWRMQSSQVRAELLHSLCEVCCKLGRFFSLPIV